MPQFYDMGPTALLPLRWTQVAEEHWWAITQTAIQPCCDRSDSCVLESVFQLYSFIYPYFFFLWRCDPTWTTAASFFRLPDHTHRRTILGRTRLEEWSAHLTDLYPTKHNTNNRQTPIPPTVQIEPVTSAKERPLGSANLYTFEEFRPAQKVTCAGSSEI